MRRSMYSSPNTIRVIMLRRMRWAGHVARMREKRSACRVLLWTAEVKSHYEDLGIDGTMIGYVMVKWVPYYHGMTHPQVTDGGDDLQVWRVPANIMNKQSRTADKKWSSCLEVRCGVTTPRRKKIILLRNVTKGLGLERILWINVREY
jgi:hypothetical protein